ncbi:MAG: copper homeostasis protein CutC [Candidatus Sulfotelmatobacter sp.]|jgi:copper homeostasis protein
MSDPILIEVCVDSVASAVAAERGGAARVEVCSNLLEGGVTPSAGLIELVRARISIGLQVMIRPRGGDFYYTSEEFETLRRDILAAKKLGADGVVLGILHARGSVDTERTRQLVELARPLNVTFHRAFDTSADLFLALEDVCKTGADRLLTSGGERTACAGVQRIARLVEAARGRIAIMACGGINDKNAASIIEQTGVREIHVGLRSPVDSSMLHRNPQVSIGTVPGCDYQRFQVLEEDVLKLHRAVALART